MRLRNRGIIVNPEDLTKELIQTLADCGINELGIHSGGGRRASELIAQTLLWHSREETQSLFRLAERKGITVEYDEHILRTLVPANLFEAHPDWFRMDAAGRRVADFNICASRDEALTYVSHRAAEIARKLKTPSHRYAYWIDDVTDTSCHCEKCRLLKPADQALRITNAILRGLKTVDPLAITGFLAYNDAMDLPEKTLPEKGVYLEYAPINRDSDVPIDDQSSEKNRAETAKLKDMLALFGTENARVLEYWMDNSRFSNWTKPPKPFRLNEAVMRRDVSYYASLGFEDMTAFGCYLGPDYEALYGKTDYSAYAAILGAEYTL